MASGRQVSRSAHRVRQQDGPRGRRLRARGRRDPRQAQGQAAGASASDRLRGKVHRRNRPGREPRACLGRGSSGRELPRRGNSGRAQGKRARLAREDDRDAGRPRRAHHGDVPRGQGRAVAGADAQGHPRRHAQYRGDPGADGLGVSQQGRAADARRGGRLSAVAARRSADDGQGRRQDGRALAAR